MANHCRLASATAIAVCNALVDFIDAYAAPDPAVLVIYDGSEPAYAVSTSNDNRLAEFGFAATAYGAAEADATNHWAQANLTSTLTDASATGGASPATYFRIEGSGANAIAQGTVGTSGADLNLNSTTIGAGATVSIATLEIRIPYNQA